MVDINSIIIDTSLETEGVWVDWPDVAGVRLRIGMLGSAAFDESIRVHSQGREAEIRRTGIAPDDAMDQAIADTVFLGFEGFDRGGEPIPDTRDERLALIENPGLYHMRRFILAQASDTSQYVAEAAKEAAGN